MTSANSSFFSRIARGNEPLLPLHTNNQRATPRSSNDYDLQDLSPRPSSPLLSPDSKHDMDVYEDNFRARRDSKDRKGKAKAVAYAEPLLEYPPMSVVDRMRLQREARAAAQGRIHQKQDSREPRKHQNNLPSWTPPFSTHFHDESDDGLQREHSRSRRTPRASSQNQDYRSSMSFVGSVLLGRSPKTADRAATVETDTTFRTIQRRERRIQEELQRLLDAQGAAIDRQISGDPGATGGDGSSQASTPQRSTSGRSSQSQSPLRSRTDLYDSRSPAPAVIPVRQPKPKPLSLKQVRNSIARTMSMLADLKAEETQYILEARQARLGAIAKANRLSAQHKTIASELKAMETDKDDPLRREIHSMDSEYKSVCVEIEEFEEKLRLLKHRKGQLERRMEEARSERESGLSGYRGALKDTERSIGDMMKRPGVRVLELDSDFDSGSHIEETNRKDSTEAEDSPQEASTDKARSMEGRVTGKEFMHLRPERRTLAMAKEWWEGETAILTRRQAAVDRELEALHEGIEVWSDVVAQISGYETRLAAAINNLVAAGGFEDANSDKAESQQRKRDEKLFRTQYSDLMHTIQEIESYLGHSESKGYNLLIAAIGGELTGFKEGEKMLLETMHSHGIEYRDLVNAMNEEAEDSERRATKSGLIDLQDQEQNDPVRPEQQPEDDLTGSVIRNWGGSVMEEQQPEKGVQQVKSRSRGSHTSSKANSPLKRSLHQEAAAALKHDDDEDDLQRQDHHHVESDNEVPLGLLSEARHAETSDEEDGHDHRSSTNEVPADFLSMHHSENQKLSTAADPDKKSRDNDHESDGEHDDHNEPPLDLMTESRREDVD
ncbi:hypothetical protein PG996_006285 [Apiospora saccharicola]|uniref:Cep57 centrosome microtubule-binding domain-containing protein n=1 Tax=Apiospora saccharicola TaxID=335842 RepID=A0ABR1VPY8_9PEZI